MSATTTPNVLPIDLARLKLDTLGDLTGALAAVATDLEDAGDPSWQAVEAAYRRVCAEMGRRPEYQRQVERTMAILGGGR